MKKYTPEQIVMFARAIDENVISYEWLKANKCPELAAICCYILHDSTKALDWLIRYDFRVLWAFSTALDDEESSFQYLMKNRGVEWAAVISAANGNADALKWLLRFNLNHFGILAKSLNNFFVRYRPRRRGSIFYGFGGGSSGGGFGGGGFGGFDGGGFDGGGAGGSW